MSPPPPLPPLLLRKYCFLCAHWLYIFVVSLLFIAGTSNSSNTPSSLIFDSKDVLPFNSTSLTIINIPSFYTVLINKLSFIETTNHTSSSMNDGRIDHFLHDFASFVTDTSFYMQCITAHTSYYLNPKFNASQVEILQPFLSNNSKVCSSPNSIYKDLMPLDTYHYSYLVLGKSPTIMFSPVNMMEPLLVILKNSIVSKTSRLSAWNFAFHDIFAYESMYEKPSSFQYVKDIEKTDPNAREEMIEFLQQLIDNDLKTFERVYNIYLTFGIGLGFSAMNNNISKIVYLENSTASFCHPIFQNKTERSNYHEALHRIDAYLYYYLKFKNNADNNQSIFDNGSTDFSKYQFKSSFHDHMDMNVDFSFYYEATRRSVFKGKFNTYLSALFNASTIHSIQQIQIYNLTLKELYHLYNSLNSSHLVGVFQAMVHPACFTYYNDYGEIYRIIGDSLFEIVANDVVYFSMVVIGILIYLANIISYMFKSSLFIKKRIFLPLVGPFALILLSLCFTFAIRAKMGASGFWIQMVVVSASTPPQNDLELNLMDSSFREMFRAYSINEFSLENLLLYEEMEFLVRKGKCSEQEVEKIYSKYIESRSEHEVNLPSDVKKQYVALMNEFKQEDPGLDRRQTLQQGDSKEMEVVVDMSVSSALDLSQPIATNSKRNGYISPSKLQDILMFEVVKNMSDTYSRLELTLEFKKWQQVKKLMGDERSQ